MIESWMIIGGVTVLLGLASSLLVPKQGQRWFKRLRRPDWLTFEWAIPIIWTFVFTCGATSAYLTWEENPGDNYTWLLMALYLLLEIVTLSYTSIMLQVRKLKVGAIIGATGFLIGAILFILVLPVSLWAGLLLLPYLIWSPIGTFITWQMMQLNPADV